MAVTKCNRPFNIASLALQVMNSPSSVNKIVRGVWRGMG